MSSRRGSRLRVAAFLAAPMVASLPGLARAEDTQPSRPAADPLVPYPPPTPRVLSQPEQGFTYAQPPIAPTLPWVGLQLIPSPEVAIGRVHVAGANGTTEAQTSTVFGLRWDVTPVVWSWGTNRRLTPWRFLVVDPLARYSGSLELLTSFEYIFGDIDRVIVRPGVRAYFPIAHRGEYLSVSMGTSGYVYDDKVRVAYDVGAYVLYGIFGIQTTIAPENGPLTAIGTFRIRYF